jgi:hypothetical protein
MEDEDDRPWYLCAPDELSQVDSTHDSAGSDYAVSTLEWNGNMDASIWPISRLGSLQHKGIEYPHVICPLESSWLSAIDLA